MNSYDTFTLDSYKMTYYCAKECPTSFCEGVIPYLDRTNKQSKHDLSFYHIFWNGNERIFLSNLLKSWIF